MDTILMRSSYCRLVCFFILTTILALFNLRCEARVDVPPNWGNLALPPSQQPGPLVSFGENILNKNETQLFLFADEFGGVHKHFIDLIPSILYGLTDDLSIFINLPYATSYRVGPYKSSGFEDAFVQLEYIFYNSSTKSYLDEATIVGNVSIPTGSTQKNPPTGFGSPSYFLGFTFNRTYIDWFIFGSPGALFTTAKNGSKFGNN